MALRKDFPRDPYVILNLKIGCFLSDKNLKK